MSAPSLLDGLADAARLTPLPRPVDWAHAEQHLGLAVPDDYRRLVDAGGAGLWFDDLRLYAPGIAGHDLLEAAGVFEDLLLLWTLDPEHRPADLPDDAHLVAWADTGSGATLFWRVDAGDSSGPYPIYVEDGDGARWERFDVSATELLLGVLRGTVGGELIPTSFMDTDQVFRPYDAGR